MRFLGVDFGEKRIGLAISDQDGRVATPLTTVHRTSDAQALAEILGLVEAEQIGAIVIGEPRRQDGSRGEPVARVRSFGRKLQEITGLPVHLTDESLTTREASSRLHGARRDRARLDALAAQILLQQALDEPASTISLHQSRPNIEGR